MSENKAYVVINNVATAGAAPFGSVSANFIVLAPDGSVINTGEQTVASFDYGASNEKILESLVLEIRAAQNDPSLDVSFISG